MQLVRYEVGGRIRHGRLSGGMIEELRSWDGPSGVVAAVDAPSANLSFPLSDVRLRAPVPSPQKFLGVWLNYRDHAKELISKGIAIGVPESPVWFSKLSSCVVGPDAAIIVPRVVVPKVPPMVDYAAELAVVIGRRCRNVSVAAAMSVVAGFTVCNDVSVRDWQMRSPTPLLGKSFDTHGPLGPWLVTPDEFGDVAGKRVRTWVNDELLQDGSTDDLIFSVEELIALLSTVCTLEPGDVIATGTPCGIGALRNPPRWLVPGDVVAVEVEGVGRLENPVVAEPQHGPL
jgi:2-keto-4-pentenoate hydratase/2-oxohepta-3-ene-1,7-dioic acid hydratase in catechol pathway